MFRFLAFLRDCVALSSEVFRARALRFRDGPAEAEVEVSQGLDSGEEERGPEAVRADRLPPAEDD